MFYFFVVKRNNFTIETYRCPVRRTRSCMLKKPDIQAMARVKSGERRAIGIYMQA